MAIADLKKTEDFENKIDGFNSEYVADWNKWINTPEQQRANMLGVILRNWQACRPNAMRRTRNENEHDAPYLEDLIEEASGPLKILNQIDDPFKLLHKFDVLAVDKPPRHDASSKTQYDEIIKSLHKLWKIFEKLSYQGNARGGLAGVVGISKATLLLTEGRVGPAFDSTVQKNVGVDINSCADWINALRRVAKDIHNFEDKYTTTLLNAAPKFGNLHRGRLYDMALGPRQKEKK